MEYKAKQLVDSFRPYVETWDGYNDCEVEEHLVMNNLKKCAMIAIGFAETERESKDLDKLRTAINLL